MNHLSFIFLLILVGCTVGPKYKKPEMAMPEKFIEDKKDETSSDNNLAEWWKQLGDPLLDSLIAEAINANFDFRIALEKITQARAQYRIERSYLFPEIDLTATATRSLYSKNFFTQAGVGATPTTTTTTTTSTNTNFPYQNFFQIGFDAIWELDFWGKFRKAKNAALYQWEATKEEAQNILITVLSEVAINYVSIRAIQQRISLTQQKINADEEELSLALVLFNAGIDNQIQVETLLASLDSDKASLPVLETSFKQTIYALAVLLGRQPEGLISDFEIIGPIPCGNDKVPVGLPSDLLRRRPDIKSAERQLAAATEQIGVAVADLFPHISLTGSTIAGGSLMGSSYGFESAHLRNLFSSNSQYWSVGPSILWNIIDFGKIRANIAVQNSLQRQSLLNYEQTVIMALKDVEGALVAYFEEQKRNMFFKGQVAANRRSLELTQDLYQAGLANEMDVLEALKVVLDSESFLIDSSQSLTSDLIALYKALGGNWE